MFGEHALTSSSALRLCNSRQNDKAGRGGKGHLRTSAGSFCLGDLVLDVPSGGKKLLHGFQSVRQDFVRRAAGDC